MELRKTSFKESLAVGAEGEKEVAIHLIDLGYSVLPLYQFEPQTAPMVLSKSDEHISPDLTLFIQGRCLFVEVKTKNQWVEYGGTRETGCNYRHYKHYKTLSEKTGVPLFLIFNHLENEPTGMFRVNVNEAGRFWNGQTPAGRPVSPEMYFWNYLKLKRL